MPRKKKVNIAAIKEIAAMKSQHDGFHAMPYTTYKNRYSHPNTNVEIDQSNPSDYIQQLAKVDELASCGPLGTISNTINDTLTTGSPTPCVPIPPSDSFFTLRYATSPSAYISTPKRNKRTSPTAMSLEDLQMSADQKQDDIENINKSLELVPVKGRTHITVVVSDKNQEQPSQIAIPCNRGLAFNKGYAYDQGTDSYLVNGIEQLALGYVPIAYEARMPESGNWKTVLPLPVTVIERYLSAAQSKKVAAIKDRYSDKTRYAIEYVQMLGCDG